MRYFTLALGVFSTLNVLGVAADDFSKCINTCQNNKRDAFESFGCVDATQAGCLCMKGDFLSQIQQCASGADQCKTDVPMDEVKKFLANSAGGFCAGLAGFDAVNPSAPPAATSTPNPKPTTPNAAPATTQAPKTSAAPQPTTSQSPPVAKIVTETSSSPVPSAAQTTSAAESPSTSASFIAGAGATGTSSEAPSGTSGVAAGETSSAASGKAPSGGLSQAASIGIGVGVGAAVLAGLGVALCFICRNRRQNIRHSMQISKPLPGSGRYRGDSRPRGESFEKYASEIEMQSNRYEDMLPRQKPRTVV